MNSMERFLAKLRELLRGKVSEEDFTECVKVARSHVGGVTRGEKMKAERESQSVQVPEGNIMSEWKLLGELSFSEDGKVIEVQIFPAVGKYSHPRYGELNISKEFLQTVKRNFDEKVYQQTLPLTIDLEHETKLSGAAGWINDVDIRGDKGMWAKIDLNDRGHELCSKDAFRYFSPEFYDSWTDPATNKRFENVLIGGGLTNRPFFKSMAPVAMMREDALLFVEDHDTRQAEVDSIIIQQGKLLTQLSAQLGEFAAAEADMDMQAMLSKMESMMKMMQSMMDKGEMPDDEMQAMSDSMDKLQDQMGKMKKMPGKMKAAAETSGATASGASVDKGLAEKPTGGESMGLTEEEARQFKEMGDNLKSLGERLAAAETKAASEAKAREAAEAEAKQARETVAVLARDANRKTLGEFVKTNRYAFQGEVEPCIDQLEKFQTKLGEDFQAYLDERKALHERVKASGIFDQVGRNVEAPSGAMAEFDAAKRKAMAENAALTEPQAVAKVATENPALYARYDHEFKRNIKRGGE